MATNIGINFRLTSGYVSDPTDTTYCIGDAYPTTRATVGTGQNVTFGWPSSLGANCRDRSTGVDARLAGQNQPTSDSNFRIDLPAPGVWTVNLAVGDAGGVKTAFWDILDSDGSTVLASMADTLTTSGQWFDATGVNRTSSSDWVSNNASINVTLSGTTMYFRSKIGAQSAVIAHIRLYQASSGPTVTTITGTTATEASAVVFTVTMSGTGGLTDAYSWSGTAGSGDYTQTLTDGMFTTTGGSGSVTVSGGNIVVPSAVTEFTVTVPTTGDTLDEANETIRLVFGGVTASSGTITDDDAAPTITGTASSTVTAGDPVVITYSPGLSGQTRTYTLALTDGTAVGGTDYDNTIVPGDFAVTAGTGSVSISGSTVTVDPGVTEFTLTITTTA